MIVKEHGKYVVKSDSGAKRLGSYSTKSQAEKRHIST
jgi:hypothetical protein